MHHPSRKYIPSHDRICTSILNSIKSWKIKSKTICFRKSDQPLILCKNVAIHSQCPTLYEISSVYYNFSNGTMRCCWSILLLCQKIGVRTWFLSAKIRYGYVLIVVLVVCTTSLIFAAFLQKKSALIHIRSHNSYCANSSNISPIFFAFAHTNAPPFMLNKCTMWCRMHGVFLLCISYANLCLKPLPSIFRQ